MKRSKYLTKDVLGPRGGFVGFWSGVIYPERSSLLRWLDRRLANKKVYGKLSAIKTLAPIGLLRFVTIDKYQRGKGYGSVALHEFLEWCATNNCRYAILEAATSIEQADGFALRRWYKTHGFYVLGLCINDHTIMINPLKE